MKYLLLFENFTGAAGLKNKLGIKGDAISDENFQQLVDTGIERNLLPAFVRFAQQAEFPQVLFYAQRVKQYGVKLPIGEYATFLSYSEAVDAQVSKKEIQQKVAGFSVATSPPDYETSNKRYRVYAAKTRQECIAYGKGQSFCISRPGEGNMYYSYRMNVGSTFYFVYDTFLSSDTDEYVTVVDANNNGFEFTHADNDTPTTTDRYNGKLKKFLKSKPGLKELEDVFLQEPLTKHEQQRFDKWKMVDRNNTFSQLTLTEKREFIEMGIYGVPGADFDTLPKDLKREYINYGLPLEASSLKTLPESFHKLYIERLDDIGRQMSKEGFSYLSPAMQQKALALGTVDMRLSEVQDANLDVWVRGSIHIAGGLNEYGLAIVTGLSAQRLHLLSPATAQLWVDFVRDHKKGISVGQYLALDEETKRHAQQTGSIAKTTELDFVAADDEQKQMMLDNDLVANFYPTYLSKLEPKWVDALLKKNLLILSTFAFDMLPDNIKQLMIDRRQVRSIPLDVFLKLNPEWQQKTLDLNLISYVNGGAEAIPKQYIEEFKRKGLVKVMDVMSLDFFMLSEPRRQQLIDGNLINKAKSGSSEFNRLHPKKQEYLTDNDLVE